MVKPSSVLCPDCGNPRGALQSECPYCGSQETPPLPKKLAGIFTLNLEENLPAMITSLQLAGQVSDIVKKRVQQRLATQKAKDARKE